ncbi:WD repeat-containing protein on Y chromosome [Megalops cyprinoides]|uniref:WD repeat-containing protein on Y chromosome n=1 Tax=Megalops cyprinoides TaxID=118141 RepID=UPI001864F65E|nr:WD repeat-containing protein on Y chromosome [Megalops cyprinoides]
MPLGKKVRPTSAAGKIQTQNIPSILTELGPAAGNAGQRRVKTSGPELWVERAPPSGVVVSQQDDPEISGQRPEWLERELLKQEHRRHSVALGDSATLRERRLWSADPSRSLRKLQIDQKVSLENLAKLKLAFEEFEKGGIRSLDMANFKQIVKKCLGLRDVNDEQIQELFMKIDYSGNGKIVWDEFCTYMQLEYTEKEESVYRSKQVALALPACIRPMCHGEPVLNIRATPDGTIVTVREDGEVYYWNSELQLKKSKAVFQERPVNRKPKWATDFVIMPQYNKLIIATGDREIQFYELSSLEPYCQVSALETVPLRIDFCLMDPDKCVILYGDAQGCVNIILMTSVGEMLRLWKKLPKVENVPNIGIDNAVLSPNVTYIRWKVHEDWVTQVKYFDSMRAIVSTSNHEQSALVIGCVLPTMNIEQTLREIREFCREGKTRKVQFAGGSPQPRPKGDQTIFPVYKGVKTFDLCKKHNILVTGGMDRLIRMWNPYVPGKPTGILKGHCAPIFYLFISSEDNRIFSVSMDNIAKIWDLQDQSCLFTAHPKASLIRGDVSACLFSPSMKGLYVAADSIALLSVRTRAQPQGHLTVSHREPVLCCGYSGAFRQVVSCTEGSVVKVWDFDTGSQVFEFGSAHGVSAITCLTFDPQGRRLVTGGRDGSLKVWNFNNGQCLKIFRRENGSKDVCDCTYLTVNRNTYVISVGWSRRIDIYFDSPEDPRHIQSPQPPWQDDLKHGHKEDILCVTQCPPSLLASSSFDGEIIVWNLVSGHSQCRFLTPLPPDSAYPEDADRSVSSMEFLRTRALNVEFTSAACLISSGPQGYVNFWNVMNGGKFFASFQASRLKCHITKLAVTKEDNLLYAADQSGYIYVYDINMYALGPERDAPKMTNYWRAHISRVTCLQIIEDDNMLLTSSTDCTVRLWTIHGEFIGTFGQSESWSIHTPSSWKHPTIPYEILIDPLSMPVHSILEGEGSVSDVIYSDQSKEAKAADEAKSDSNSKLRYPPLYISDKDIEEEIKNPCYPKEHGKRLRHEIFKNANRPPNHGGPKAYHTLKYFEIADTPTSFKRPDLSLAGMDPFLSSFAEDQSVESH